MIYLTSPVVRHILHSLEMICVSMEQSFSTVSVIKKAKRTLATSNASLKVYSARMRILFAGLTQPQLLISSTLGQRDRGWQVS